MSGYLCHCPYCQERDRRLSSLVAGAASVAVVAGVLLLVVMVLS